MSLRHEDLNPEELSHQDRLDRSWMRAQSALSDPSLRSYLEQSIERVNNSPSDTVMTKREFLADTELSIE